MVIAYLDPIHYEKTIFDNLTFSVMQHHLGLSRDNCTRGCDSKLAQLMSLLNETYTCVTGYWREERLEQQTCQYDFCSCMLQTQCPQLSDEHCPHPLDLDSGPPSLYSPTEMEVKVSLSMLLLYCKKIFNSVKDNQNIIKGPQEMRINKN